MNSDELWNEFKNKTGLPNDLKYIESFHFELTEYWANELLRLVLEGNKKATSSSVWANEIENERVPQEGDYSVITDWDGNAKCIIKTTKVTVLPFKDITYDLCKKEGEDDSLESWRNGHISFFEEDGKELGYKFTEDMPVIFDEFEVVYRSEE